MSSAAAAKEEVVFRILVVDDEPVIRELLDHALDDSDRELVFAGSLAEARAAEGPFDLAVLDKNLPDGSGLDLLTELSTRFPDMLAIMMTAYASVDAAIAAVKARVFDFLTKPFDDVGLVELSVSNALHRLTAERQRLELYQQLAVSEERYALASQATSDGLWDWDLASRHIYLSTRWKSMLGYEADDVGTSPDEWFSRVHPDDLQPLTAAVTAQLGGDTDDFETEYRARHRDGSTRWVRCRGVCIRDAEGKAIRMVGSQSDITGQKELEAQLVHDALHDALTGLPNRALFNDRLEHALEQARRSTELTFAVLFVDLDRFKNINDSLGHQAGDELLVALANRLRETSRASDTLARLGGDEFALLLDDLDDDFSVQTVVERIEAALRAPFTLREREVVVTASIGIALGNTGYSNPEEIVRDADTAMYRAKAAGKDCHEVFVGSMHEQVLKVLEVESALRRAIEEGGELELFYQPIFRIANDYKLAGFEALVRWQHPERGFISPGDFVPIAEETGLVLELDEFVLHTACRQIRQWNDGASAPLFASVNLSARNFADDELPGRIRRAVEATAVDPTHLKLEITEGVFVDDVDRAAEQLAELKKIGPSLSLDDFGTGYSALSHLHQLPFDVLKIDRSFVARQPEDKRSAALIEGIITMAHALEIDVVAEGIETDEQLSALISRGCGFGQGYLLGRPMNAESAKKFIEDAACGKAGTKRPAPGAAVELEEVGVQLLSEPLTRAERSTLRLVKKLKNPQSSP